MYNLNGDLKENKVNEILSKLTSKQISAAESDQNIVEENRPFKTPDVKLAPSTPGPRISTVPNVYKPHSPNDSLRIINHLGLTDDDCRYIRAISLIGLATEYSVKKLRKQLLGNDGKGWSKAEKMSVKKWFRNVNKEVENTIDGKEQRQEVVVVRVAKDDIETAVQHWATKLTEQGQYVDMQEFENCPEILHDSVLLILGNDSGQGFVREGVRFGNRIQANSGSKVFISTLVEGSDKSLSMYQKQFLFSSLTGLRHINKIFMGGRERKLYKFLCMDYEAAAQEMGTQVGNYFT